MRKPFYITKKSIPRSLIIAVQTPQQTMRDYASYASEFTQLVTTARTSYTEKIVIKLRAIDAARFFTKGKLHDIKALCDEKNIEEIIISEHISSTQERNLKDFTNCKIIDRTLLILEIFEQAAQSAEGKLQVGIALLQHKKSRLSGKGIHLAQQRGGIGLRAGPGEKQKVRDARYIEQLILKHKKSLERLERARTTQRKKRLNANVPHIALIGYTNAGKSTLLNALTKSNVLAQDKLFATLDTTTRSLFLDGTQQATISDTVGFIQQLPHRLIDAFKSTLSELHYADLLLHVIDASSPNWHDQIDTVHHLLHDLDINKPIIYVFNKSDAVKNKDDLEKNIQNFIPHVIISAKKDYPDFNLEPLKDQLLSFTHKHTKKS